MSFINHVFFVLFYFIVFNFEYQSANRVPFCPYRMKIHTLTYPHTADIYTPPYTAITMSKLFPKWTIHTLFQALAWRKKEKNKMMSLSTTQERLQRGKHTHTYTHVHTKERVNINKKLARALSMWRCLFTCSKFPSFKNFASSNFIFDNFCMFLDKLDRL